MKNSLWLLATLVLMSCNERSGQLDSATTQERQIEQQTDDYGGEQVADTTTVPDTGADRLIPVASAIIRHASIRLRSTDFKTDETKLKQIIKQHKAWIANETLQQTDDEKSSSLIIKVPAESLDACMQSIVAIGARVEQLQVNAEDVTARIIDTRGRWEAKRLIRARYLDLLQQAHTMADMLELQQEVNKITEDMEVADYTIKHLQAQVRYSTIEVILYEPMEGGGKTGFAARIWDALKSGASSAVDLFVGILSIWPVLLIITLILYWIRKRIGRSGQPVKGRVQEHL